jgi:hypothetical protein
MVFAGDSPLLNSSANMYPTSFLFDSGSYILTNRPMPLPGTPEWMFIYYSNDDGRVKPLGSVGRAVSSKNALISPKKWRPYTWNPQI